MQNKALKVEDDFLELPKPRRQTLQVVRQTILDHLPAGYEEGMQYGMIGYYVPQAIHEES